MEEIKNMELNENEAAQTAGDQLGYVAPCVGDRDGYEIFYKNTAYNPAARNSVLTNPSLIEIGYELIV